MPAIHILGGESPGRKTFRMESSIPGRGAVEFMPERGMITLRCPSSEPGARSEHYERLSCATFAERLAALRREVQWLLREANSDSGRGRRHRQEALKLQRVVDCMAMALTAARDQGDPVEAMAAAGRTRGAGISRPTFESHIGPIPMGPPRPHAAQVRADDPRRALILPPGSRRP